MSICDFEVEIEDKIGFIKILICLQSILHIPIISLDETIQALSPLLSSPAKTALPSHCRGDFCTL